MQGQKSEAPKSTKSRLRVPTFCMFFVALSLYLSLIISSGINQSKFNTDDIIDTQVKVPDTEHPNMLEYRSFLHRMYLTSPVTVVQYNDVGNSENNEDAKNYFYPKDLHSKIYGLAWHIVVSERPTFVWDEMSATSMYPLGLTNDYSTSQTSMNKYTINKPHRVSADKKGEEFLKDIYKFSLFAQKVYLITNHTTKTTGYGDITAKHTGGNEEDLKLLFKTNKRYNIWKKDPEVHATSNEPSGQKEAIETVWDTATKYVQGQYAYFVDQVVLDKFKGYPEKIVIKGYSRVSEMDNYFSENEIKIKAPKFFENLTAAGNYAWEAATNEFLQFTYTPKYILPTVIMDTVYGKVCNGTKKLDESEVRDCMENFRIVSGLPPHDLFVDSNNIAHPWGPLCLEHESSHINDNDVRTKFQWYKPRSAFMIERFMRAIAGKEEAKENLKERIFVEIKKLSKDDGVTDNDIEIKEELTDAQAISIKDLESKLKTDNSVQFHEILAKKTQFKYTTTGKNPTSTYYKMGCISTGDATTEDLFENAEQRNCRWLVQSGSSFFQAAYLTGVVFIFIHIIIFLAFLLRFGVWVFNPGWLGQKNQRFAYLNKIPTFVSFTLDALIAFDVVVILIYASLFLSTSNCVKEHFGLTTEGETTMSSFSGSVATILILSVLTFLAYVFDFISMLLKDARAVGTGTPDGDTVREGNVYVSVPQLNMP